MNTDTSSPSPLLTREPLRQELAKRGFKVSKSYWNKINLPYVNAGPPVAKWWGKRPLHDLDAALAWAESRCGTSPGKIAA
jgi:hypothetical protein